jgi:MFS family permease
MLWADAAPPNRRGSGFGFHRSLEYMGALVGPAIAYVMLSHGVTLRTLFAWTAAPGALCLIVLGWFVREVERKPSLEVPALGLAPSAGYRHFLVAVGIFTFGSSSDAFLLWRAREVGIAVALAPVLWMVLHLVKSGSSFFGGALSDRYGRRVPIISGWGL